MTPSPVWHLSFDAATKTFAFSLTRFDYDAAGATLASLRRRATAARQLAERFVAATASAATASAAPTMAQVARLAQSVAALDTEARALIRVVDGDCADLVPDVADDDIPTVRRVRAVVTYVRARVLPALAARPPGEPLRVYVEYQMGQNARARTVAAALLALFCDEDVVLVGPSLKNKVALAPHLEYPLFAEKYARAYDANKAHALANYGYALTYFASEAPHCKKSLQGHIADSFMQVLGHLAAGAAAPEDMY